MGSIDTYPPVYASTANAVLGYAEITASQGSITSEVDVTGLSVTVFVPAGRKIKITGHAQFTNTNATQLNVIRLQEDGVQIEEAGMVDGSINTGETLHAQVVRSPAVGVHVYKMRAAVGGGTGTLKAGPTQPAFIMVEDITGGTGGSGPIQLAYSEITANVAMPTTLTDVPGLSATVSVPAGIPTSQYKLMRGPLASNKKPTT
jgi:hypothetical protein